MAADGIRASLFVTCLVDQFYPQVGEATVKLLRRLGVQVDFPPAQTCCGQPAFNSGFRQEARSIARQLLKAFRRSQFVVTPSGSCASMLRVFYPELFHDDPVLHKEAKDLAGRTYELSEFVTQVLGVTDVGAAYNGSVTYHPSCHLLRELGVRDAPLELLRNVKGLDFKPAAGRTTCCGFGGTFSVKYPYISEAMLDDKLQEIEETGANAVVSCDMGCLMHIGGGLSRKGSPIRAMHLAELLTSQQNEE